MFKNLSIKVKLNLFLVAFIFILIFTGVIFGYYNGVVKTRVDIALKTDVIVQDLLKSRISVYQFLRNPNS